MNAKRLPMNPRNVKIQKLSHIPDEELNMTIERAMAGLTGLINKSLTYDPAKVIAAK